MRRALEWAQVRALATDARLARSDEPPRYRRAASGSQLDPLELVIRRLLGEWPQIKALRLRFGATQTRSVWRRPRLH